MANTFNLGNGNWAQKTEKLLAYNAENNNYKPLPFDFDRASTATRVNRDGLIETVDVDEPRIDFLNNSKGHLLLEPQRTNLIPYSENFTSWVQYGSPTINISSIISPDGTLNGSKITRGSNATPLRYTGITTLGTEYTFSLYAKKGNYNQLSLDIGDETAPTFTLTDEWQRFEVTSTPTTYNHVDITLPSSSSGDFIYIWAAQLEAGSYATSYIPTSGQSGGVTRSAENAFQQNVTQVIGQSEGTMYIEFVPKDISASQILYQIRTTGSSNVGQIDIRLVGGQIIALANDGGSGQFNMGYTSFLAGTKYKVAVRYKLNDSKIYVNGSQTGSDVNCSFTSSSLDQVSFAENLSGLLPVADILDARLYDTGLSDSELETLTTL